MKKFLSWNLLYSESPQTSTQSRLTSLSALTANHYVRHHHHTTLEPPPFINAYYPFHHPSSYYGCQDTPTSLVMTLQTEQQKKPTQLNQTPSIPHQVHASFRSSMNCSVTILLLMPKQRYLPTSQYFDWPTANTKPQRWCIDCSSPFWPPFINKNSSSSDWPRNHSYLSIMLTSRPHTLTLAYRVPSGRCYSTTSVWEPLRVTKVACLSTWRCDSVGKEDLGRPWCLTSVTSG